MCGIASVVLVDAVLLAAVSPFHSRGAGSSSLLGVITVFGVLHAAAVVALYVELTRLGMLRARQGVVGMILTTVLFAGIFVALGVLMWLA